MGWQLKIKEEENQEPKYKIWSTISDSYLIDNWMTREDVIRYIFWYKLSDFVEKFTKSAMTFPEGYSDEDTDCSIPIGDKTQAYREVMSAYIRDGVSMGNKFLEILEDVGLGLKITEGEDEFKTKNM